MKKQLLLLHGALGSASQFDSVKNVLKDNFEVYTLNFEGHGGRESDNDFSIALFAKNVISFLDKKNIDDISIFGYSMGGYVALYLALTEPKRIISIVTLGTKFNWSLESAHREVKMLNPNKIEEKVPRFAEYLKHLHIPLDWKLLMQKTADMMLSIANGKKLKDSDFIKINHEVVIGIGSLDNMVTLEESEHVTNLMTNSQLVKVEGVPHPIDKINTEQLILYITEAFQ